MPQLAQVIYNRAMCGRFTTTQTTPEVLQQAFNLATLPAETPPRYNIAPTQDIMVVAHNEAAENTLGWMRWGLIPSWFKGQKFQNQLINARGETIHEKNSFRASFKRRRCLIPADGFFEWRKNEDGSKTPLYIKLKDGAPFAFAGLWDRWENTDFDETILSCTIITCQPNALMADIHNRMPVILPADKYADWLSRDTDDPHYLRSMLQPYDPDLMTAYEVSRAVNSPANDRPDVIAPA